jgi:hypothetical protein
MVECVASFQLILELFFAFYLLSVFRTETLVCLSLVQL